MVNAKLLTQHRICLALRFLIIIPMALMSITRKESCGFRMPQSFPTYEPVGSSVIEIACKIHFWYSDVNLDTREGVETEKERNGRRGEWLWLHRDGLLDHEGIE